MALIAKTLRSTRYEPKPGSQRLHRMYHCCTGLNTMLLPFLKMAGLKANAGHNPFSYDETIMEIPEHLQLGKDELLNHDLWEYYKMQKESRYDDSINIPKNLFLIFGKYINCNPDKLREKLVLFVQREYCYVDTITETFHGLKGVHLSVWLLDISKLHARGNELVVFLLSIMLNIHTTVIYRGGYLCTVDDNHSNTLEEAVENSELILAFVGNNFFVELVPRDDQRYETIKAKIIARFENTDLKQWLENDIGGVKTRQSMLPLDLSMPKNKPKKKRRNRKGKRGNRPVTSTTSAPPPEVKKAKKHGVPKKGISVPVRPKAGARRVRKSRRKHTCDIKNCGKIFNTLRELNCHNRSVHISARYKCDQCAKEFRLKSSLARHRFQHQPNKFSCALCDRTFRFASELKSHREGHNKRPRFKCDVCNKRFQRSNDLKRHLSVHDRKKWHCEMCNYRTSQRRLLRLHKAVHKPPAIKCTQCDELFRFKNQLRRHLKKKH